MKGCNVSMLDILVPWSKAESYLNQNLSGLWQQRNIKTEGSKPVREIVIQDPSSAQKCTMYFLLNDHGMLIMQAKKFGRDWYIEDTNEATIGFFEQMARECTGTVSYYIDDQPSMIFEGSDVSAEFCVVKAGTTNFSNLGPKSDVGDSGGSSYQYYLPEYLNARPTLQQEVNSIGNSKGASEAYNRIIVELLKERQAKQIPSRQLKDLLEQLIMFGATHSTGTQLYELLIQEDTF